MGEYLNVIPGCRAPMPPGEVCGECGPCIKARERLAYQRGYDDALANVAAWLRSLAASALEQAQQAEDDIDERVRLTSLASARTGLADALERREHEATTPSECEPCKGTGCAHGLWRNCASGRCPDCRGTGTTKEQG